MMISIVIGALSTVFNIGTRTRGIGNKRTSRDHPNNSIVEIGKKTKKTWRTAVTQTPVENNQLTLE